MKFKLPFLGMFLMTVLLGACAQSSLSTVEDVLERQRIEESWIRNKSLKITPYYPDQLTMERVKRLVDEKGIRERDVSEILYYSLEDGRHVMYVETDEADGRARYHCFGLTKGREVAVHWVQFQELGKPMKIEKIEKPHTSIEAE